MGMLQRLSHDLRAGWVTLRHGTAKAAPRARLEEGELLCYRLELRKVDQQLDDLHSDIGERTIEFTTVLKQQSAFSPIRKSPASCNRYGRFRASGPNCCSK